MGEQKSKIFVIDTRRLELNTRAYSKAQENKIAKKFGGERVANSGATAFDKGDVKLGNILVEAKTQTKAVKAFQIKEEWLIKLNKERMQSRKEHCALAFQYEPDGGALYFVLNERDFKIFCETVNNGN